MPDQPVPPPPTHPQGPDGEHEFDSGCFWCLVFAGVPDADATVTFVDPDQGQQ